MEACLTLSLAVTRMRLVVELAGAFRKPRDPIGWYLCLCNGIPVRFAADREVLVHYASDPEYRASLIARRAWEKNAGA
jgi:hypothetical protein